MDRERLKALGLGAVASYGMLSNLVYCTGARHLGEIQSVHRHSNNTTTTYPGMAVTWVLFVKQRGVSPLAAGQWGPYLAFYAGFWTINNLYVAGWDACGGNARTSVLLALSNTAHHPTHHSIRPFRFGIAVAMAPVFDRLLDRLQSTLRLQTKRAAFGVYVAALGIVTCVLTFGSIGAFAGPQAFARA